MKKHLKILLAFFSLFLLAGCTKTSAQTSTYQRVKDTNTIVWGIKNDTRLFGITNIKTGKVEGFETDLAKALTKKILGKKGKAEFTITTAKTKIPLLNNNAIDAVIAVMTITDERKKVVNFSKPYFNAGQSLLVKNTSKVKSIKDLNRKGAKVLAVKGTTAVANVHKYAPKATVLEYDDYGQALSALKSGQGDAMTTDNGILAGLADENKGYKLVGGTFTNEPYGIAVKKGNARMVKAINQALSAVKADGTYQRLVQKWFGGIKGFNLQEVG